MANDWFKVNAPKPTEQPAAPPVDWFSAHAPPSGPPAPRADAVPLPDARIAPPSLNAPRGAPGRTDVHLPGPMGPHPADPSRPSARLPARLNDIILSRPPQADFHTEVVAKMPPTPRAPERTWTEAVTDKGVAVAQGVVSLGEAAVGIADAATLGMAGGALRKGLGFDPKLTNEILNTYFSKKTQEGQTNFAEAEGLVNKAKAVLESPELITHSFLNSLPLMAGAGGIARGLVAAGMGAVAAGAVGEGAIGAGLSLADRDSTLTTPSDLGYAVATGGATAVVGRVLGRLADRLGVGDVDTLIAGGSVSPEARRGLVTQIVGGMTLEGLEELGQGTAEQVLSNSKNDRPLTEGLDENAILGTVTGMVMGGGANAARGVASKLSRPKAPAPEVPVVETRPLAADPAMRVTPTPPPEQPAVPSEFVAVGAEPVVPPPAPPVAVDPDAPLVGTVAERAAAMRAENPNIGREAAELAAQMRNRAPSTTPAPEKTNIEQSPDVPSETAAAPVVEPAPTPEPETDMFGQPIAPPSTTTEDETAIAESQTAIAVPSSPDAPTAGEFYTLPPDSITVDPSRFQFKAGGNTAGVTSSAKIDGPWNEGRAGVLMVWQDPADGKTYVVNGHHRLEAAKRLGAERVAVRYLDAPDAKAARIEGAWTNIAEDKGTATDAAKLIRDAGANEAMLIDAGLSPRSVLVRDAIALAQLSDPLFDRVATGDMDAKIAAAVGEAKLSPEGQAAVVKLVERQQGKGRTLTPAQVRTLAADVASTPEVASGGDGQADIFGLLGEERTQNVAVEKAVLRDWVSRELAKDKKLFGFVAKGSRAADLARGGNRINIDQSKQIADEAATIGAVFDTLAGSSGPIARSLNTAATQLAEGGNPDAVRSSLLEAVRTAVAEELGATTTGSKVDAGRAGRDAQVTQKPHHERGVADSAAATRPAGVAPRPAEVAPAPAADADSTPQPYSVKGLTFGGQLTDDHAVAIDALVQAVGLDTSQMQLAAGGTAGPDAMPQGQTDTPAFRAWFRNSKVVDVDGKPLVVYHGTRNANDLVSFDPDKAKSEGKAFYFSHSPLLKEPSGNAETYTEAEGGAVLPVYLSLENPLVIGFTEPMPVDESKIDGWLDRMDKFNRGLDYTKESYVKSNIDEAKRRGHDGVIIRGIEDDRFDSGNQNATDVYIAFKPTQIKSAIGNRGTFDPNNPNILQQGERKKLSVIHNLSAENLVHADGLGGLPVPSLAIVNEDGTISGFGEITLIGRQELADPSSGVPVYDADAYSPRFPRALYPPVKSKVAQKLMDEARPYAKAFEDSTLRDSLWDKAVNDPKPQDLVSDMLGSNGAKAWFLKDTDGTTVEPVMEPSLVEFPWVADAAFWADYLRLESAAKEYGKLDEISRSARAAIRRYAATPTLPERKAWKGDALLRHFGSAWGVDGSWVVTSEPMPFTLLMKLDESRRRIGQFEIDHADTRARFAPLMEGKEIAFKAWVEDKILPMFGPPYIKSGRKKVPYVLSNIVEEMSGLVRNKEETMVFGPGAARAAGTIKMGDLNEMRNRSEWQLITEAEFETLKERSDVALEAWRGQVVNHYGDTSVEAFGRVWEGMDASMRALARWVKAGRNEAGMRRALHAEGFRNVPNDVVTAGVKAGKVFIETPVPYFEAKPQRAVALHEFAGAIIPASADATTKAILDKHEIPYRTYEGERTRTNTVVAFRRELAAQADSRVLFQPGDLFDELDTGEQQPRLPGDVGEVREQEVKTPELAEVEFSLSSEISKPRKGGAPPRLLFQSAWHGSPHIFEQFSLHKIGTGEGAQAYGWGLYFASNKKIAAHYRNVLRGRDIRDVNGDPMVYQGSANGAEASALDILGNQYMHSDPFASALEAIGDASPRARELAAVIKRWKDEGVHFKQGRLYKVDIPENEDYLDWDKTLSEQPEKVRTAVEAILQEAKPREKTPHVSEQASGKDLYQRIATLLAPNPMAVNSQKARGASEALAKHGIAGIRYRDGSSRYQQATYEAKWDDTGTKAQVRKRNSGDVVQTFDSFKDADAWIAENDPVQESHNFVVFDDKLIQIMEFEQGEKASVEFIAGGQALIRAFKSADVSSAAHEIGHVIRRFLLNRDVPAANRAGVTDQDIATTERWAGATDGWTRAAEEKFARGFERYLRDGRSPSPALAKVFGKFSTWLSDIYRTVTGSAIDVEISPEMREVFDRIVTRADRFKTEQAAAKPPPPATKKKTPKPRAADPVEATSDSLTRLDEIERAARARLKERGTFSGGKLMSGIPVDDITDLVIIGAMKIAKGTVQFAQWSADMVRDFGEAIRPHLKDIFEQARLKADELGPRPMRADSGRPVPDQQPLPADRVLAFPSIQKMPESIRGDITDLLDRYKGFESQRRGVQSHERTEALAKDVWLPLETLKPGTAVNAEELKAYQDAIATALTARQVVLDKIKDGTATDWDKLQFSHLTDVATILTASYRGAKAETGRALNILRVKARILDLQESRFLEAALKAPGFQKDLMAVSKAALDAQGDPLQQLKLLRQRASGTWFDYVQAFYYTNLLSGVKTHLRNIIGNSFNLMANTIAPLAAGPLDAVMAAKTGRERTVFIGEVREKLAGGYIGLQVGIQNASFTFREGFRPKAITAAATGVFDTPRVELHIPEGVIKRFPKAAQLDDTARLVFNYPSRALEAADEFFRAVAYHQELYAGAYARARTEGLRKPDEIHARMAELMTKADPTTEDGKRFERLREEADEAAARSVFQETPGPIVQWLLKAKSPTAPLPLRTASLFLAPFIKTPSAILKQGLEWSPAGFVMKRAQAGGRDAAKAQGQAALGSALLLPITWLAVNGLLTGAPPDDEGEREEFYAQGKLANAVRIGNYWVRYSLFQPQSIAMAAVSNSWERFKHSDQDAGAAEEAFIAAITGAGASLMDQSFLSGLGTFLDAVNDPTRYAGQWLSLFSQGFVPYAGLMRNISQAVDPVYRKPKGVAESVQAIIPGASSSLPPRRTRLGEPATRPGNFVTRGFIVPEISKAVEDDVTTALAALAVQPTKPRPKFTVKGKAIDITEAQQDTIIEAIGRERRSAIERVLRQPGFKSRPDEANRALLEKAINGATDVVRPRVLDLLRTKRPLVVEQLVSPHTRARLARDAKAFLGEAPRVVAR
ncbi:MAG: ParB N-terminal domain-containing protein [Gemmatimonadaceae bacterium]|nr:ParB N-terminal domain-containing protein [Gemmatimonadaceae bacterium]